jgi:hypothetical protein
MVGTRHTETAGDYVGGWRWLGRRAGGGQDGPMWFWTREVVRAARFNSRDEAQAFAEQYREWTRANGYPDTRLTVM